MPGNVVDIQTTTVQRCFQAIQVDITKKGPNNFEEFQYDKLRSLHHLEFFNPQDSFNRGVWGYVSFGTPAVQRGLSHDIRVSFTPCQFLNWDCNLILPPPGCDFQYARIWLRKNVEAYWYTVERDVDFGVGGNILTPGVHF